MTVHTPDIAAHAIDAVPETHGRYDMYVAIHKALRRAHCDMLIRLGTAEFSATGLSGLLDELRALLAFCGSHIAHEEAHIHPALEARMPAAASETEDDHGSHRKRLDQLEEIIGRLEHAESACRPAIGREFYLAYSLFAAHDFIHMFGEETRLNASLWAVFADEELMAIEGAIKAGIAPEKAVYLMRLMLPAVNRTQRVMIMADVKAHAPQPAFVAIMELAARATLSADDMADLERRLALTQCVMP